MSSGVACDRSTTNAFGTCPASSSAIGTTAASAMQGCVSSHRSSSAGVDVESFVLDQLLHAIDDEESSARVGVSDVAGVQPAIGVDDGSSCIGSIQIALHDLRTAHADLSFLVGAELGTGCHVDNLRFGVGHR